MWKEINSEIIRYTLAEKINVVYFVLLSVFVIFAKNLL